MQFVAAVVVQKHSDKEAFAVNQFQRFGFPNKVVNSYSFNSQRPSDEVSGAYFLHFQPGNAEAFEDWLKEKEQWMYREKETAGGTGWSNNPWSELPKVARTVKIEAKNVGKEIRKVEEGKESEEFEESEEPEIKQEDVDPKG